MTRHPVSQEIIKMTKEAIERVGKDEFDEVGPDDVMDLDNITEKYKKLTKLQKIQVSTDLRDWDKCSDTLAAIMIRIEQDLMMDDREWDRDELRAITEAGHQNLRDAFSLDDEIGGA